MTLNDIKAFKSDCIQMSQELAKRTPETVSESALFYVSMRSWIDLIDALDKAVDAVKYQNHAKFKS